MSELPKPMFLERQSYRRRRIIDACLLLPVFGGFLFMIPLLWEKQAGPAQPILAQKGLYIFCIWFALVAASGLLSRKLSAGAPGNRIEGEDAVPDAPLNALPDARPLRASPPRQS